ncbi:hypothetical protein RhiirA1_389796 [Rhizophagus irregularis]|uniref:Uncharacterized protein n=1 Tax=Rhizophagus irregularis TaxID=588596 RepID=A0A2N0S9Z3_9GLOM|nr:hypothetical protein RhiirA1_389796 [Rhizophagus irregularis]
MERCLQFCHRLARTSDNLIYASIVGVMLVGGCDVTGVLGVLSVLDDLDGIDEPFTTFYENYVNHVSNPMTKNFASRALEAIGLKARMLRIDFEGCKKSAMILRALADELRQLFSLFPPVLQSIPL